MYQTRSPATWALPLLDRYTITNLPESSVHSRFPLRSVEGGKEEVLQNWEAELGTHKQCLDIN
jgi:hypothetical protein